MTTNERIQEDRIGSLDSLESDGFERYPNFSNRDCSVGEYVSEYSDTDDDFESDDEWTLAGRVSRINDFGDIYFFDIEDESGVVQLQFDYEHTPDSVLNAVPYVSVGDVIEANGNAIRSNSGELTLHCWDFRVLSKSLSHPPSNDGLSDEEEIRQRSMALQYDEALAQSVRTRFEVTQSLRDCLVSEGYLEV